MGDGKLVVANAVVPLGINRLKPCGSGDCLDQGGGLWHTDVGHGREIDGCTRVKLVAAPLSDQGLMLHGGGSQCGIELASDPGSHQKCLAVA